MKQFYLFTIIILTIASCSDDHKGAIQRLENSRQFLSVQEFGKAKAEIDSLNKLYPKSFEQREAGILLLDSIRKAENNYIIGNMDKQLADQEPVLEKMKGDFVFLKDEKYQETGSYISKNIAGSGVLSNTTLRVGVEEDGRIYLESVYVGGQKHNRLKVSAGDLFAETLEAEGDGFVYRFTDLGKTYEVIRFIGANENKVSKFIAENSKSTLKVQLSGQHTTSYTLSQTLKDAVRKSYELSSQMLLVDSLKAEKEKAEFRNFYLDNDKQLTIPIEE